MLLGVGLGYGSKYIPQVIGKYTNPAVFIGLGFVTKKQDLMTIGAYELGRQLQTGINIGGGSTTSNTFYE